MWDSGNASMSLDRCRPRSHDVAVRRPRTSRLCVVAVLSVALLLANIVAGPIGAEPRNPDAQSLAASRLDAVVATYGANVVYSDVYNTTFGLIAFVAYGVPERVDFLIYSNGAWKSWYDTAWTIPGGSVAGIGVRGPQNCTACFQLLTLPNAITALVIPVFYANAGGVQVVALQTSGLTGIPFAAPGHEPQYVVANAVVHGDTATTASNDCNPDCATGHYTNTEWKFNPPTLAFRPVDSLAVAPSARMSAALAYDDNSKKLVLFGGVTGNGQALGDTWTWDGQQWQRAESISGATATNVDQPLMIFDDATHQLLLVAFAYNGEKARMRTWSWSGQSWDELHPAHDPSMPANALIAESALGYDVDARQAVLLVGVAGPEGSQTSEDMQSWTWTGRDWVQLRPPHVPPPAPSQPLVYDGASKQLLREGVTSGQRSVQPATWAWNGHDWSELQPANHPPALIGAAMAYDPSQNKVIRYGGISDAVALSSCSVPVSNAASSGDAYKWNGDNWTKIGSLNNVSPRHGAAMAYDDASHQLVLFGGCDMANGTVRLFSDTNVINGPAPTDVEPGGGGDCGTGLSLGITRKWASEFERKIQVVAATISFPHASYINLAPYFEPGDMQLCFAGLTATVLDGWGKDDNLSFDAKGPSVSVGGSDTVGPFTYSADSTSWISAPGAPVDQEFTTSFAPKFQLLPGPALDLSSAGLDAYVTLFEVDFLALKADIKLAWKPPNTVLALDYGPTLALEGRLQKKSLVDELAKAFEEDAGDEAAAEEDVVKQIAADEDAAIASEGEGLYGMSGAQIETLLENKMSPLLRASVTSWLENVKAGSADAAELDAEGVTPDEVPSLAEGALDGAVDAGDAIGGKILCDVIVGGPEDLIGDVLCAAV
jgi:hypothetical protein